MDITNSSLEHKVRECEDKDEVIDNLREENRNLSEKNDNLETMNKYFAVEKQKIEIKIGKSCDENLILKREIAEAKSELKEALKELKTVQKERGAIQHDSCTKSKSLESKEKILSEWKAER